MFIALITALLKFSLAYEAQLVTLSDIQTDKVPKVPVYEFTDGRSSYFSTYQTQSDSRWRLVKKAFCVAGAFDPGYNFLKPLDLWVRPYLDANWYDSFLQADENELASKGNQPTFGRIDKHNYGYFFMGRMGFVGTRDMGGMVPLYRYWDDRGKHYFTVDANSFPPETTTTFRPENHVAFVWRTC